MSARPTKQDVANANRNGYLRGLDDGAARVAKTEPATQKVDGLERGAYWRGCHRGVWYKVNQHWKPKFDHEYKVVGEEPAWCFYIYISKDAATPEMLDEWDAGSDSVKDVITRGCTRVLEMPMGREFGADYGHLWDEGMTFTAAEVAADCRRDIDNILGVHPELKRWTYMGLVTAAEFIAGGGS